MTPISSRLALVDDQTGVLECLPGGGYAKVHVAVGAPGGLEVHPLRRVEIVHLARDLGFVGRRIPARDAMQAGPARDKVVPDRVDVLADRADDAEAGDGYAA